ncbi:MAG TPA: HD domain-containing protein, partial [Candidatus Avacidaminococcus intestinavium]|nr:HD domain-containing protein [Candidatus Avacidaminococcus intestinavium]
IQKQCKNVRGLSLARVKKELEKLLLSKNCAAGVRLLVRSGLAAESCQLRVNGKKSSVLILPEVAALSGIEQNPLFHRFDVFEHTLQALAYSKAEAEIRWALLLHDLGKGKPEIRIYRTNGAPADPGHEKLSAEMAEGILQRLQFIPTFRRRVVWLVANHMLAGFFLINGMSGGEKWLRRLAGEGTFRSNKEFLQALQQLHNLVLSDMRATNANAEAVQRMQDFWRSLLCLAEELPVHTKELALDGRELGVFVQNAKIGPLANNLLRRVQNGQLQNRADVLMIAAEKWAARYDK